MRYTFIMIVALAFSSCGQAKISLAELKSGTVGLDRQVSLYSASGNIIRRWDGRFAVEDRGGSIRFVTEDGKAVIIGGTYVIEQN